MSLRTLRLIDASILQTQEKLQTPDWLWEGLLARNAITYLEGEWNIGKTTLVTGLFQHLATGEPFLGRKVQPGNVIIVSEDSDYEWSSRVQIQPLGDNIQLIPYPHSRHLTIDDWNELMAQALELRQSHNLDLFVVDTASMIMPADFRDDKLSSDGAYRALRRLTDSGIAVLLLDHSGTTHNSIDNFLELKWPYRAKGQSNRRMLISRQNRFGPVSQLTYEWDRQTGGFQTVESAATEQFESHWRTLEPLLRNHPQGLTIVECVDLLAFSHTPPSFKTVYRWLKKAHEMKRVQRSGAGSKSSPYIYRLPS